MSIEIASRLILRSRLTLHRLTYCRNPWSCGEGVFHTLYRYLCLHLLFQNLQHRSRDTFYGAGMLSYLSFAGYHRFGGTLYARLSSAQGHSTSELLRTL
jgi:hypothetical protein